MMKKLFLLLLPAALVSACASTETADASAVKQSEIYQSYSVSYTSGGSGISAVAQFRFGGATGTTLRLSSPAGVTYNGKEMTMGNMFLTGTTYSVSLPDYTPNHEFVFTDQDGKKYKNSLSLPAADFMDSSLTVPDGKVFSIPVALTDPSNVTLYASDTSGIDETMLSTQAGAKAYYDKAANAIIVQPEFFQNVKSSEATLQLRSERTRDPIAESGHLGGSISISYSSKNLTLRRRQNI